MRTRTLVPFFFVAACAFGVGRAAEPLSSFRLVVGFDSATNAIALRCTSGCAWTDLTFACGKDVECHSSIDEYGMAK